MQHDADVTAPFDPRRGNSLCVNWQRRRRMIRFAPRQLELGNIGDVFDRCALAQASEKTWKGLAITEQAGRARRLAGDEPVSHRPKRFIANQPTDYGKTCDQDVDRPCGKCAVRSPPQGGPDRDWRQGAGLELPGAALDSCGRGHGTGPPASVSTGAAAAAASSDRNCEPGFGSRHLADENRKWRNIIVPLHPDRPAIPTRRCPLQNRPDERNDSCGDLRGKLGKSR